MQDKKSLLSNQRDQARVIDKTSEENRLLKKQLKDWEERYEEWDMENKVEQILLKKRMTLGNEDNANLGEDYNEVGENDMS